MFGIGRSAGMRSMMAGARVGRSAKKDQFFEDVKNAVAASRTEAIADQPKYYSRRMKTAAADAAEASERSGWETLRRPYTNDGVRQGASLARNQFNQRRNTAVKWGASIAGTGAGIAAYNHLRNRKKKV
jgi:hypothetical protein